MTEKYGSLSVELTPALMLECKLTWKKLSYFFIYINILAVFLHIFGFGASFFYSLIYCNCGAWSTFAFLISFTRILKPETSVSMLTRVIMALFCGTILGAIVFTVTMGIKPALLLDEQINILFRMALLNIFFGSFAVFFLKSQEHLSEAKRLILEEKLRNLDIKNMSIETELKLLQAQIEPHFLFNTLSNIISLIDTDPDKARTMMEHFSGFLRESLHISRNTTVPVSQELALIRNYLEIQSVRMGTRLSYRIDMPEFLLSYRIPPLLIQPLVENAIKHGIEPKIYGGELWITGEIIDDVVKITVADSGRGIMENANSNGIGLENIRKRIQMFCNQKGRLVLEENEPIGIRATIEILP